VADGDSFTHLPPVSIRYVLFFRKYISLPPGGKQSPLQRNKRA
jgi:hypothetical protein